MFISDTALSYRGKCEHYKNANNIITDIRDNPDLNITQIAHDISAIS